MAYSVENGFVIRLYISDEICVKVDAIRLRYLQTPENGLNIIRRPYACSKVAIDENMRCIGAKASLMFSLIDTFLHACVRYFYNKTVHYVIVTSTALSNC